MKTEDIINIVGKSDDELRSAARKIIESHNGRGAITVVNAVPNSEFKNYILSSTSFLDNLDFVNFSTRLYMFAYDLKSTDDIPHCTVCGKLIERNVISVNVGFKYKTCSVKCAANDSRRNKKIKDTLMERHGDPNWNNREKNNKTCMERYGVTCTFLMEDFSEKSKKTKLERYGNEKFVNHEAAMKTKIEKYGMGNNGAAISATKRRRQSEDPDYYSRQTEKSKLTRLERYGDANYNNHELMKTTKLELYGDSEFNNRNLAKQTCIEKYGVTNPSQRAEVKAKIMATCLEKYGYIVASKCEEFKLKSKQTQLAKYGVSSFAQLPDRRIFVSERLKLTIT